VVARPVSSFSPLLSERDWDRNHDGDVQKKGKEGRGNSEEGKRRGTELMYSHIRDLRIIILLLG
jgi:hypothetical protein